MGFGIAMRVAAMLGASICAVLPAQVPVPQTIVWDEPTLERDGGGTRLPSAGRREGRLFKTALEHLEAGRSDEAVVYLQTILDAEADGFYEVDEKARRPVSLRAEAARRLEESDEARQAYELRYGPTAKSLLDEALTGQDVEKLAAVARRFPAADAGREAAFRLVMVHLDGGEPLAAVARLGRLRKAATGERRTAVLLRLAVCYERLGEADRRDAVLAELANIGGEVTVAGGKVALSNADAVRGWVASAAMLPPEAGSEDWPVAGGGAGRTNHRAVAGGLRAEWSAVALSDPFRPPDGARTATDVRLAKWAAGTGLAELAAGRPGGLSSQPVAAGDTVFFRTPAGVSAIDAVTGRHRWRTRADELCWDYLPGPGVETPNGEMAARTFVGQRLWSDATWGTLATDGRVVFAVVETGVGSPLPPPPGIETDEAAAQPVLPVAFNRMAVYDAATGGRVWEAGGPPAERGPLAGAFFLGPPVPAGGCWYALVELSGVTQLVAIDPSRPDGVLWTQPVAEHDSPIDADSVRRTAGLSPCVGGGLLVCPVGPGLAVAVDPSSQSLVWAYGGKRSGAETPLESDGMAPESPAPPPEVAAAGDVLLIGSQAGRLAAVDPLDGSVRWEIEPPGYLWLMGADDAAAYVQTPTGIVAVRLSDGSPAWDAPAAIGPPAGRGVMISNRLYAPLLDQTIAVLDVATGRSIGSIASPYDEAFGNLIVLGGTLVSQSATRVVAMPLPK